MDKRIGWNDDLNKLDDDKRDETRKIDQQDTYDYTPDSTQGRSDGIAEMTKADYRAFYNRLMPQGTASSEAQFSKLKAMDSDVETPEQRNARVEKHWNADFENRCKLANSMAEQLNRGLGNKTGVEAIRENGFYVAEDGTRFELSTYRLSADDRRALAPSERAGNSIIRFSPDGGREIAEIRDISGFIHARQDIELEFHRAAGEAAYLADKIDFGDAGQKTMLDRLYDRGEGAQFDDKGNGLIWKISEDRQHVTAEYMDIHPNHGQSFIAPLNEVRGIIQDRHDSILEARAAGQAAHEAAQANKPQKPAQEPSQQTTAEKEALFTAGNRIEQFRNGTLGDTFAADMSELSGKIDQTPNDKQQAEAARPKDRDQIVAHLSELEEGTGFSLKDDQGVNRHYNLKGDALSEIVTDGEKVEWNVYDANDTEKLIDSSELQRSGQAEGPAHFSMADRWSMGEERPPQVSEDQWKSIGENVVDDMRLENTPAEFTPGTAEYARENVYGDDVQAHSPQGETLDAISMTDGKTGEYVENTRHQGEQVQATGEGQAQGFKKSSQANDEAGPDVSTKTERGFSDIAADHERLQGWSSNSGVAFEDYRDQKQAVGIELRESIVDQLRQQPEGMAFDNGNSTFMLKGNELLEQTFTQEGKEWAIWDANDPSKELDSSNKREQEFASKFGQPTEAVNGQQQQEARSSSIPDQQKPNEPAVGQAAGWNNVEAPAKSEGQEQGISKATVNNAILDRIIAQKAKDEAQGTGEGQGTFAGHFAREKAKEEAGTKSPDKPEVAHAKASQEAAVAANAPSQSEDLTKKQGRAL